MVAAASAGAAAVRKADPLHYPPAPHAYFRLADHELAAPLLCAVCFERVEPNNLFQVTSASNNSTTQTGCQVPALHSAMQHAHYRCLH